MFVDAADAQWDGAAGGAPAAAAAYAGAYHTTFTIAGAAVAAAASNAERIKSQEASASNWQEFHKDSIPLFLRSYSKLAQVEQEYSAFLQQQVTHAVTTGGCSVCGLSVSDCRLVRTVEVTVIDIGTCCTVKVPVVECSRCERWQLEYALMAFQAATQTLFHVVSPACFLHCSLPTAIMQTAY
jgi:hypothetical protein